MVNSLNLPELDQEQALNLSKFFIKSKQNLFLFGRKGTGKTELILQAAKECNVKVNYINLSVVERTDLAGYPNLHSDGDIITFKSPYYLQKISSNEKANSIILFDEVDKAPCEVTSPLLEILQFRKINGVPINATSCFLTGNLINEGAYSNLVSTALLDRGAKYILTFNFEKWFEWAKNNDIHDLILGFLKSNPDFACGKVEDCVYASPSPRSWTLASNALIKARQSKIVDIESVTHIISGFVGMEAGIRFKIWYENYKKFEPYAISIVEKGNVNFNYNSLTPSEKVVFIITVCHFAKQKIYKDHVKNNFSSLENICNYFIDNHVDNELLTIGLYNAFSFDAVAKLKLYECKIFFDLFTKISESGIFKK